MGVKGWTKFLVESGWLPSNNKNNGNNGSGSCCLEPSLWRNPSSLLSGGNGDNFTALFASRITTLPTEECTLLIDGNGLAFHLLRASYARFARQVQQQQQQVLRNNNKNTATPTTKNKLLLLKNLSPLQAQQLLPNYMPLRVLEQVTLEYISALLKHNVKLVVYWDGPGRRGGAKQTTDRTRSARVDDMWDALRSYCVNGMLPTTSSKNQNNSFSSCGCICCEWQRQFPSPRLFLTQVKHTLTWMNTTANNGTNDTTLSSITMKYCREECDYLLARDAASATASYNNAYVLAADSDFCFFPNTRYIPFSTLHASRSHLSACVITRSELAASMGFSVPQQESLLIELALLCGNDYLVDPEQAGFVEHYSKSFQENWDFLLEQEPGFQLSTSTSASEEIRRVLGFVRTLYSLGNLEEEYPLDDDDDDDDESNNDDDDDEAGDNIQYNVEQQKNEKGGKHQKQQRLTSGTTTRPSIPEGLDLSTLRVDPTVDRSPKDTVLRFLQLYLNRGAEQQLGSSSSLSSSPAVSPPPLLTPLHVYIFRSMTVATNDKDDDTEQLARQVLSQDPSWRPKWEDELAVYVIARAIGACLENSATSPLVRFASPAGMFHPYRYHVLLQQARAAAAMAVPGIGGVTSTTHDSSEQRTTNEKQPPPPPVVEEVRPDLPVDEHEHVILETIRKNRITIIQGETGCGKSSRIPVMILNAPPPDPSLKRVKIFISQPRRIAAKALVERLRAVEPDLKDQFALRMGHGVREYEGRGTRAWFVTAGYLVRLLAGSPEHFNSVSHLIVDEVHERSVETDLLCLLCRRLLSTNLCIRLVLMSATLAAKLYQDYFGVPEPPIKVGSRRFPVREVFIEDLESAFVLSSTVKRSLQHIKQQCDQLRCKAAPNNSYMEKLYPAVAHLAMIVGKPGSSVLVFVPGMLDIVAISEAIDQLHVSGIRFTCFPIHSDIPFEDQMDVFAASEEDEVKVIIATNAAESSVTLPEVDHVICLGLCKQIIYNEMSHRQMLVPTWISRASATQRAGRTGRLRPGTVYRLYTRQNYDNDMNEFEPGEISRIPLDNVILMLKGVLADDRVTDVLLDTLEPPNISTIDRSFESLYRSHFITEPEDADDCAITTLGNFVSSLGIDLALGSLIGLGIQYGVGPEAIQMAGVLSFPKTPWIMSSPLIHEPKEYNEMTKKSYVSKCHFDANLFSEPLATMNMLWEFERKKEQRQNQWCWENGLALARVRRLLSVTKNLRRRVAEFFDIDDAELQLELPPSQFPHSMVTTLRVLQAWVFYDTIIECQPKKVGHSPEGVTLSLGPRSNDISKDLLEQILCNERHPCSLTGIVSFQQRGKFSLTSGFSVEAKAAILEERFVSYAIEKEFPLVWFWDNDCTLVYVNGALPNLLLVLVHDLETTELIAEESNSRRGVGERACGQWKIRHDVPSNSPTEVAERRLFQRIMLVASTKAQWKHLNRIRCKLVEYIQSHHSLSGLACDFSRPETVKTKPFCITSYGRDTGISKTDLSDLFAASSDLQIEDTKFSTKNQMLVFPITPSKPLKGSSDPEKDISPSWARPPLDCIPEGARLLSVLASGRRREHLVRLDSRNDSDDEEGTAEVNLYLDPSQTKLSERWKRLDSNKSVYVNENCVPATALPLEGSDILYCAVSNTLEVKGGGLRVEGLTLLPSGPLFLLLSRLSFGLVQELQGDTLEDVCTRWLLAKKKGHNSGSSSDSRELELEWRRRINMAFDFHESSVALGEELVCFPDMARRLKAVFDGVDGYEAESWDVEANAFTRENLLILQHTRKARPAVGKKTTGTGSLSPQIGLAAPPLKGDPEVVSDSEETDDDEELREAELILQATCHLDEEATEQTELKKSRIAKRSLKFGNSSPNENASSNRMSTLPVAISVENVVFEDSLVESTLQLFATDGQKVDDHELPSTNLLALVVEHVRQRLAKHFSPMDIKGGDWTVCNIKVSGRDTPFYEAMFAARGLCFIKPNRNGPVPSWFHNSVRPNTLEDALDCVPHTFRESVRQSAMLVTTGPASSRSKLVFGSIEMALRMEAAFWLERQFRDTLPWYEQGDVADMIERLVQACQNKKPRNKQWIRGCSKKVKRLLERKNQNQRQGSVDLSSNLTAALNPGET